MTKNYIYCIIIICILFINSCAPKNNNINETMPGIDIPLSEYNSKIWLYFYPGEPNIYQGGDALFFILKNRSGNTFIFPQDFGVKIYIKKEYGWWEIENNWGYPEGENILPPNKILPGGLSLSVWPDVGDLTGSAVVRIVVVGHVEGESEQVGAFIDVQYDFPPSVSS